MEIKSDIFNVPDGHITYVLVTDDETEHLRKNQPCYGELRKYERTHKGECTQPKNEKPTDLHNPFPAGTPTSLYIPVGQYARYNGRGEGSDRVIKALFGPDSPWYSGFKDVEFIDKGNHLWAVKLNRLDIDPTVLVNCLKQAQNIVSKDVEFISLLEEGLTENEAIAALMLNSYFPPDVGAMNTNTYACAQRFSARRFFEKKPLDLSGGTLEDRVDYNRTRMQDPFHGDASGFIWRTKAMENGLPAFKSYTGPKPVKMKDATEIIKKTFSDALKSETAPTAEPFVWTTTSGKTNGNGTVQKLG